MSANPSFDVARKRGASLCVAGGLFVAILLALIAVMASWRITVPYLYADEWPVVARVSDASWVEALRVGHNGVPSYYQNLVWWADYHLFGQNGVLPRCFQDGMMLVGLLIFSRLLGRAGLSRCELAGILCLVVSLWYSGANSAQYFHYVWCGFEKSLAFLLLSATSALLVSLLHSPQPRWYHFIGVLATAWSALYIHGGFALLPVIAIILLLARPSPRGVAITLGVAVLFLLHYHRLHYQPEEGVGATVPVWEWLYGFCLLVAGMLYHLLVGPVGPVGAGVGAVALALTVVGVSAGLALKTVQRKATALDLIALVFMGYALLLALAAVVVRARVFGWEYVLASRYSSMSIFAAVGLLLAWWNRVRQGGLTGCSALIRPAGLATLVALFFLLVLGMLDFLRGLPPRNNSVQTYMIPYTLEPWSLPAAGMTNPRRMRSAAYMRDRLVANNKGVFGSRAYQGYRDFQPDALAAPVPTGKGARAEVTYIESQGEHQLLHLKIQAGEPGVRGGYLWIVLVDGQKAGWALPVNDVIGFPAPGPASPRVASGFSLARATNHTLRAILLNHAGVPLLQTEDCRIGNAPAPSGPMARSQG